MVDRIKAFSFIFSAAISLFMKDPLDFLTKFERRFGIKIGGKQVGLMPLSLRDNLPKDGQLNYLVRVGKLQDAQELIRLNPAIASRAVKQRISVMKERLSQAEFTYPRASAQKAPQSKLNIVYYATNSLPYTQSGYSLRTHSLTKSLGQFVDSVDVLTRYGYPLVVGRLASSYIDSYRGVRYHRSYDWRYPNSVSNRMKRAVDKLEKLCIETDACLIHTTTDFQNAIVVAAVADRLGIPWIYEVRGEPEKTWLSKLPPNEQEVAASSDYFCGLRQAETKAMESANFILTLSEVSKEELIRRGIHSGKIAVIPNAIDEEWLNFSFSQSALRAELSIPKNKKIIGTVTSLVSYEGLDIAISAMKKLGDDYNLVIVGDGEDRPRLELLTKKLCLEDRVQFVGRVPDEFAWKWYGAFDVFAVPRLNTPVCRTVTPIKPVLAQAFGIPVVATDLPALREICGGTGVFFTADCPYSFAEAVQHAEAQCDAEKGKAWVEQYTWDVNSKKLLDVYTRLCGKMSA